MAEGFELGCLDGSKLGSLEGSALGSRDGDELGNADGMSEGSLLGSKLGSTLGVLDGFELGSSVALPMNRGKSMGLLSTQLVPSVYCPSLLGHTRGLLYAGVSAY